MSNTRRISFVAACLAAVPLFTSPAACAAEGADQLPTVERPAASEPLPEAPISEDVRGREPSLPAEFAQPLLPGGADPWVIYRDGQYIHTHTTGVDITLWRAPTLAGLRDATPQVVWRPPPAGPWSRNIWAPELHFLDGKWYIYFAADDGRNENHRMYVLEGGSDPMGPYQLKGKIADETTDRWAIDGTVLEHTDGKRYFLWSGWEGDSDGEQGLYIAPMETPWSLGGPRVRISAPDAAWERERWTGAKVNEAPQVLQRDGRTFIVYSADQSWTDNYKLGLLTLVGDDVLNPQSWRKAPVPVFRTHEASGVWGPGHASFVKSPDGREDWIIYHAARTRGSGWLRDIRAQTFRWNPDGTPRFGLPLPLPLPQNSIRAP